MLINIIKWDRDYHCPRTNWYEEVVDEDHAKLRIKQLDVLPGFDFFYKVIS